MSSSPARTRRAQLWSVLGSGDYNKLLRGQTAIIQPLETSRRASPQSEVLEPSRREQDLYGKLPMFGPAAINVYGLALQW
jgi:hypothetical protein